MIDTNKTCQVVELEKKETKTKLLINYYRKKKEIHC